MEIPLTDLRTGQKARISQLQGGRGFIRKVMSLGIRENKVLTVIAIQPFGGPVVIEIDGRDTTIGRGMAEKIIVEVD